MSISFDLCSLIKENQNVDIEKIINMENILLNKLELDTVSLRDNSYKNYIINPYEHEKIFKYLKPEEKIIEFLKINGLYNLPEGIVVKSDFLHQIFMETDFEINELNIYFYKKTNMWDKIKEKIKTVYFVDAKIYTDKLQILLKQNTSFDKIIYENNKIYISNSFMLEYLKCINNYASYDPNISKINYIFNSKCGSIHEQICQYNINFKILDYELIKENRTPIEYALYLYLHEKNYLFKNKLKIIINRLSNHRYWRLPIIYYNYLGAENFDKELQQTIINIKGYMEYDINVKSECSNVNDIIIEQIIKNDDPKKLFLYCGRFSYQINEKILDYIVKYNSRNVLVQMIENNKLTEEQSIYCILLTQYLDYIEKTKYEKMSIFNVANDNMNKIIGTNKYVTFYYLYEIDKNVLSNKLLEYISDESIDLLNLLMKLNNGIMTGEFICKNINKNIKLLEIAINNCDLNYEDSNKNNILHHIVTNERNDLVRYIFMNKREYFMMMMNRQNKFGQSPIILSALNANEIIFYLFYNNGALLNLKDEHDNTVYHYICKNRMCLGMTIINTKNKYGFYPKDYSNISADYWNHK